MRLLEQQREHAENVARGRDQAADQLEHANQRIAEILASIQDDFYVLDRDWRFVFVSRQFAGRLGKEPKDFLGNVVWEMFPKHLGTVYEDNLRAAMANKERREFELQGQYTDVWYRMRVYPSAEGILLLGTDITERKQAEAARRRTEDLLHAFMAAIPEPVFVKDSEGHLLLANPATLALLGKSADQVIGKTDRELYDDAELGAAIMENDRRVLGSGHAVEVEEMACTPQGERKTYLSTKAPWRSADGQILGLVGISRDITERKRAEESLREANERLADSDRRKDEFLAVLSHELRNPLTPVLNSLYILGVAEPGSEMAGRAKAVIDRQVGQMVRLVDDLLDVTRISRGKIQLRRAPLDLSELLRKIGEDHRAGFDRAEVRLDLQLAGKPLHVNADAARMAQVVGNLLHNASKFTGKGGRVRVSLEEDTAHRMAVIRIRDNGIGMAPPILQRLFAPFVQAEASLDRSQGGLGLGLAIAKGMVELHGGKIEARSEGQGQGAEFIIRLPLHGEAAADVAPSRSQALTRGHRVLIIEDNTDAADTLGEALRLAGHEVTVAYNGPDGIAKARAFKPEVVLCDIGLPDMDGLQVARAFRSDQALEKAYMVAISGYALPEDVQRSMEAGFNRHISKPPNLEKLEGLLATLSDRR